MQSFCPPFAGWWIKGHSMAIGGSPRCSIAKGEPPISLPSTPDGFIASWATRPCCWRSIRPFARVASMTARSWLCASTCAGALMVWSSPAGMERSFVSPSSSTPSTGRSSPDGGIQCRHFRLKRARHDAGVSRKRFAPPQAPHGDQAILAGARSDTTLHAGNQPAVERNTGRRNGAPDHRSDGSRTTTKSIHIQR